MKRLLLALVITLNACHPAIASYDAPAAAWESIEIHPVCEGDGDLKECD